MILRTLGAFALLLTFSAANGARLMEQPERPYELSLAQITLPSSASGAVTIKPCESCPYTTHVLTSATEFYINDQPLPYAEFSQLASELLGSRRERAFVTVFVDVTSERVTRVKLRDRGLQ
jgi:hypothetical protein